MIQFIRLIIACAVFTLSFNTIAGDANFSGFDLWLSGVNRTATFELDNSLKLTNFGSTSQKGYAYIKLPIEIKPNTSFSTKFSFAAHVNNTSSNILYASGGISFILHNDPIGLDANYLGGMGHSYYQNIMSVVFDSFSSEGTNNLYGDAVFLRDSSDEANLLVKTNTTDPVEFVTRARVLRYAWIDYNGEMDNIQIFLSASDSKPLIPIINNSIDLNAIVGDQAFVGFAAGTGAPSVHSSTQEQHLN